jgi:arabinofuranosyltransferase
LEALVVSSKGTRPIPPAVRILLVLALAATLLLLLAHAWFYRFQCDDAFISFRYARNLSHGHGLVFNPGAERVEGYTNFLWVLMLAAFDRLGIPPENAANPLSLCATVALWALVVGFAWRSRPESRWVLIVPALLLATTRSVAVWSTSGLETRWFELLLLAGVLRLTVEVQCLLGRGSPPRALAGWLLALATLTRPDGLLVSASVLGTAALLLASRRRLEARWVAGSALPYIALVGGHYLFRRLYYGDWLPNTYYAKVGGKAWWAAGRAYLGAFALEYAAYLWLPLLAAAVLWHVRRGTACVPLLFAAAALPHALYVAAVGGDHFEFRPLDAYFPLAFLLIGDGVAMLASNRAAAWAGGAWLTLVLVGLWELPWQTHRQFPDRYLSGFPGLELKDRPAVAAYLDPGRDVIFRTVGLRAIAGTHQRLVQYLTSHFVAIRQEEHRMFLDTAVAQANRLRGLMDRGFLPRDVRIAVSCVGAIPYYLDVFTLDRLGLTDARVAHSPFAFEGWMAHGKLATLEYARERRVDLWAVDDVHLVVPITSKRLLMAMRSPTPPDDPTYAADVGDGEYLLCRLPLGIEQASRRMPQARFRDVRDQEFIREYVERATGAYQDLIQHDRGNTDHWRRLAFLILVQGRVSEALALYERLSEALPGSGEVWENLSLCQELLGDRVAATASLDRALAIARSAGDTGTERTLLAKRVRLAGGHLREDP